MVSRFRLYVPSLDRNPIRWLEFWSGTVQQTKCKRRQNQEQCHIYQGCQKTLVPTWHYLHSEWQLQWCMTLPIWKREGLLSSCDQTDCIRRWRRCWMGSQPELQVGSWGRENHPDHRLPRRCHNNTDHGRTTRNLNSRKRFPVKGHTKSCFIDKLDNKVIFWLQMQRTGKKWNNCRLLVLQTWLHSICIPE